MNAQDFIIAACGRAPKLAKHGFIGYYASGVLAQKSNDFEFIRGKICISFTQIDAVLVIIYLTTVKVVDK